MSNICENILGTIGNTPLIRLNKLTTGCKAQVVVKNEAFNPGLSAKDRIALNMIEEAEKAGIIKPGVTTIVEPTSGNTGIGLAMVAAVKGYKAVFIMPETMSVERRVTMAAFGAEIILTPGKDGMAGTIKMANHMKATMKDVWIPQQFENQSNPAKHEATTGPEVWRDTAGAVDYFIAGVGTGGTVSGTGRYLKSQKSSVKVIAVEPTESQVLAGKPAGQHKIQGIGANFVPGTYDKEVIDEIIPVKSDDAFSVARDLASQEGIFAGISGGAAVKAALDVAKRPEAEGKLIVVVLPDSGARYLSSALFASLNDAMAKLPTSPLPE